MGHDSLSAELTLTKEERGSARRPSMTYKKWMPSILDDVPAKYSLRSLPLTRCCGNRLNILFRNYLLFDDMIIS